MNDEEWRKCVKPAQMRSVMNSWPRSQQRWVFFDLACIDRVLDLIDDQGCLDCIHAVSTSAQSARSLVAWYSFGQEAADEAIRRLWLRRTDPLRDARIAATRAVARLASHTLAPSEMVCVAVGRRAGQPALAEAVRTERILHASLIRCVFRNTLLPVSFSPSWRTNTALLLARMMYESRDFSAMPILADALQDAGCDNDDILNHCRDPKQVHVRGCWVIDLVLGK